MATAPEDVDTVESPRIPDHALVKWIGKGACGEVWLARSTTGVHRGVKVVYRKTFTDPRPFDREFEGVCKFEPISRAHDGVVSILHVGRNDQLGYFFYIMEVADDMDTGQRIRPETYVPRTISADLKQRGRFSPTECIELGARLSSALAHLHRNGLIHRDIKPSNIIFVNGQPKLADIGLVTEIGEQKTGVGTLYYMPPEGPGTPLGDIYGLGKVLYQLATGKLAEQFPALPTALADDPDLPTFLRLNEIILKACEQSPLARYQSAEEMQAALASLQGGSSLSEPRARPIAPRPAARPRQITILCDTQVPDDARLLQYLAGRLRAESVQSFHDDDTAIGVNWARNLEKRIREADTVVILLSSASVQSEMVAYEIELAHQAALQQKGRPVLLPVRVQFTGPFPDPLRPFLDPLRCFVWESPEDNERLFRDLSQALAASQTPPVPPSRPRLEPTGGAVPLDSKFYVERPTDHEFQTAIARHDSIVLVKGARQMGKTSLLARGLHQARQTSARVVLSDLQKLSPAHFSSVGAFFQALGEFLAEQLDLSVLLADVWDMRRSANTNFERYLRREVLGQGSNHIVWGLDEVDRLFGCEFGNEVFGLFRSWHNERALDPGGPWSRLTLAIAYATEAHLFISDINQSPFNVGTRLILDDFNLDQVRDLNQRHGEPLRSSEELLQFFALTGGQPYLVRRGLNDLAGSRTGFPGWASAATAEGGVFSDHLRRILVLLARDEELLDVVRRVLRGQACPATAFYRLRSAGVLTGDSPPQARPRCGIYSMYLKRHLL